MSERCPRCKKPFATIDTKVIGEYRHRYLGCRKCKTKPEDNKRVIPLRFAPIRLVGFALSKRD